MNRDNGMAKEPPVTSGQEEERALAELSARLKLPVATSRQFADAPFDVIALIPEHIAQRYHCIALARTANRLTVAVGDAADLQALDTIRDLTMLSVVPVLGRRSEIRATIARAYRLIALESESRRLIAGLSAERGAAANADPAIGDSGIISLVNLLVRYAIALKASDIHIEPSATRLMVRVRVDGVLQPLLESPLETHAPIVARVKIMSNLDIAERRLPQDGRLAVEEDGLSIDVRVSVLPSTHGEKVVLRILDKESFARSIATLGFTRADQSLFEQQVRRPYGMIIATGPTGCGKSTTLYAAVEAVKSERVNIITVEDPVEFDISGATQVQVNPRIGLSFATALRAMLRQDPDIILIGEIRDAETADIAIKMSLTGHLVFSTLHTNDAVGAIVRLVDIGVPPLLLSSSLNCVVAQRLVRRICPHCCAAYAPSPHVLSGLGLPAGGSDATKFYRGSGCVSCNGTGYSGRTGIFEILEIGEAIRDLIVRGASSRELQETACRQGMRTLRGAGMERAMAGETTLEEVLAATSDGT